MNTIKQIIIIFTFFFVLNSNAYSIGCNWSPPYPPGQGLFQCAANGSCFVGDGSSYPAVCDRAPDDPDSNYNPDGSPKGTSPQPTPAPLPFLLPAVLGAVALAAGLMAGLAAFASAPAIVPALALATALGLGLAAMPFGSSNPPITPANLDTVPPIKVTMAPSSVPAPELGAPGGPGDGPAGSSNAPGAPPSVATNPDGTFVPRGATPYTNAAKGGWQSAGAPGEYNYYPPATATNPNPKPILVISQGGANVTQALSKSVSGYPTEMLSVTRTAEGQTAVTQSANVPVSGPDGNPALAKTHKTTVYQGHTGTSATPVGDPVVRVNPSLSDGTPVSSSARLTVLQPVPGSGTGTGTGTATGTGTGTATGTGTSSGTGTGTTTGNGTGGGCTGGDCASESTQLANKAHLKSIDDFLKGEGTQPGIPDSKTTRNFTDSMLTGESTAFEGVLSWRLPNHQSSCPKPSFQFIGKTFKFESHCDLISNHFDILRSVFVTIYLFSGLFIVLKA